MTKPLRQFLVSVPDTPENLDWIAWFTANLERGNRNSIGIYGAGRRDRH